MNSQDIHIIRQVLSGDTGRFRILMDRYSQLVFTLVVRIVDSTEYAEEVTQDVFLKAFRNLDKFDGRSSFSTWLYRIAYNEAVARARRGKVIETVLDDASLRDVSDAQVDSLLDSDSPRLAALPEAIDRLTVEERALITFHYFEEIPLKEVAEMMGLGDSAVKVRLMRTRKKLYVLINEISRKYV